MITPESLMAAGIARREAEDFAEPLRAACALHAIDKPQRVAAFVAQAAHESARFTRLEEGLYYTSPERILAVFRRLRALPPSRVALLVRSPQRLANAAYAGVNGNGDEASGDGWAFRGRGLFQLTGRDNYLKAAMSTGRPYLEQPDLVAQPADAALTAAWFFAANGCNALADAGQVDAITRRINGPAMLAAAERAELTSQALAAFS